MTGIVCAAVAVSSGGLVNPTRPLVSNLHEQSACDDWSAAVACDGMTARILTLPAGSLPEQGKLHSMAGLTVSQCDRVSQAGECARVCM